MLQTDLRDDAMDLLRFATDPNVDNDAAQTTALAAIGYALCAVVDRLDELIERVRE